MMVRTLLLSAATFAVGSMSYAAFSISPLATFGGGDGWRAPGENLAGDSVATSPYPYLGTSSLERGLAYNPTTGNLILVSRSTAGNGIRVLSGTTGADVGFLNQGSGIISGGTFATNAVAVADDGKIYVGNLAGATGTNNLKLYQWSSEAASAPTVFANATPVSTVAGRLGDNLDAIGGGTGTRIIAGYSGAQGYALYSDTGVQTNVSPIAGTAAGDFRLGITFAGADNKVWGKQTGTGNDLRRTTAGSLDGSNVLTSAGEAPMDVLILNNNTFLATVDVNSSLVRIYNANDPANLLLLGSATTTAGTLASNGNATGAVRFGPSSIVDPLNGTATLYAMSSNQGIQAFSLNLVLPEPASLTGLAGLSLLMGRRRK